MPLRNITRNSPAALTAAVAIAIGGLATHRPVAASPDPSEDIESTGPTYPRETDAPATKYIASLDQNVPDPDLIGLADIINNVVSSIRSEMQGSLQSALDDLDAIRAFVSQVER